VRMHVSVVYSSLPLVLCKRFCQLRRQALQNCTQKKSELKKKIQVDFGNQTKMLRQKRRASFNWLVLSSQISTFQTLMKFADSFLAQPSISFLLLLFVACLVLHHYSLARGYNKLHCQRMSGLVTS